MMSNPRGNLCYCFTPIAVWIADTPEESLLAGTSTKVSPVTTATATEFDDAYRHPSCTAANTLAAIYTACSQYPPTDCKNFLKAIKQLQLNGIVKPCWKMWLLSEPSNFITPEMLHHFHWMFWDHNVKWCIATIGATKLDFRFSLIQTLVGYRAFNEGILKLKQVTSRDHRAVQHYIIAAMAGSVSRKFLKAIRALLDFWYLAQAPLFTTQSIERVTSALQEFHDHKDSILKQGVRDNWKIPKLELLQSVVPSIRQSGAMIQWSADITEHTHVNEIKVPARASNNQNYYSQISRHLDWLDKCSRFDLATYIEEHIDKGRDDDEGFSDLGEDEDHKPAAEKVQLAGYSTPTHRTPNYFSISASLLHGTKPFIPKPCRTFTTSTTGFHLATKPSSQLTVNEAATTHQLPDLEAAIAVFFSNEDLHFQVPDKLQIWDKVCVQQLSYHNKTLLSPQTLHAIPPLMVNPHGRYDSVIISPCSQNDWPKSGLVGHSVTQLRIIFCMLRSDLFLAYVQHFGHEVHSRLTNLSSYEFSNEFWLNKFWSKELYYTLSSA